MPIVQADIKFFLSGGAGNADVNASLGGIKSSTELVGASLANLFDAVDAAEAQAGDVEYRCIYAHNNHGTLTLQSAETAITTNTPDANSLIEIGLGTSGVNGIEQSVADESTAPVGVTFSDAAGYANALAIGDMPAGQHMAIWVRRTITAGAGANNLDNCVIDLRGQTAA